MKKHLIPIVFFIGIISCQKENPTQESFNFNVSPKGESEVNIEWADMNVNYTVNFNIDSFLTVFSFRGTFFFRKFFGEYLSFFAFLNQ